MDYDDFRKTVICAKGSHKFKVTNSYGIKEAWRWIKKNKWLNIGQPITELQLGKIIKAINNTLGDQLLEGKDVLFPQRMGGLEIRKFNAKLDYKDGKVIENLPVDWKKTISLWYDDKDSYRSRKLVKFEGIERFTIYYNKKRANFENKSFYQFIPLRTIKKRLRTKVINGGYDALLLAKSNEIH